MKLQLVFSVALIVGVTMAARFPKPSTIIKNNDPSIHFNGRWDSSPGTWWAGSGFKLNVKGLSSMSINLGPHTTSPLTSLGVSIDYGPFVTVNVSEGTNSIPISLPKKPVTANTVVRVNDWEWQNNRMNLENIVLNPEAELLRYTPSRLAFQFIGDSLSAGQYLPQGVDQAWPVLTGEFSKAEYNVNAQPGITLTDIESYGNIHGMTFQFFKTEDTGYYYTMDHNFTTSWNFERDIPPTHVIIHIGANDSGQNVTTQAFLQNYLEFFAHVRTIYKEQPVFLFSPWGWPQADGPNSYYYPGIFEEVVNTRHSLGDRNVFLVNTTGWVTFADVFPDNLHPTVAGHQKIAGLFEKWLQDWGLHPEKEWATTS